MSLKKLKILSIIITFLFCFPLHFLYNKFPSFITSIISPVNESIWEHMKILFGSILLSGVFQKIIIKIKHLNYKNIYLSTIISSLSSIPIFLIIYLPIYNLIGEKFLITIFLMLIAIIISQVITIYIINLKKDLKMENISILFIIITYLIFIYLTYNPIKCKLFKDPVDKYYGIKIVSNLF